MLLRSDHHPGKNQGLLNYDITFRGVGAHGAKPNTGIDPIVMASEAVMQFQTIPSRSVSPLAPSVVTVGSFHAGKVWNIIPDEATLQLTTRFYDTEAQKLIDKRNREICQGITVSNGSALPRNLRIAGQRVCRRWPRH